MCFLFHLLQKYCTYINVSNLLLVYNIGLDNLSGIAALLKYSLPGVDDIEEEDIDIDELINQEEQEEEEKKSESN